MVMTIAVIAVVIVAAAVTFAVASKRARRHGGAPQPTQLNQPAGPNGSLKFWDSITSSEWNTLMILLYSLGGVTAFSVLRILGFLIPESWFPDPKTLETVKTWATPIAAVVSLATSVLLAIDGFRTVEPNSFAEPRLWGWRAPFVDSKWFSGVPIFGSLEEFTVEPYEMKGKVLFVAGDDRKLAIPYYAQFRVDEKLKGSDGRNTFLSLGPDQATRIAKVISQMEAELESKLGALGGVSTSDDFKRKLKPIEDFLRASFQLESPTHTKSGSVILADKIPEFYETNRDQVSVDLRDEVNHPDQNSPIEKRCGVDVLVIRIKEPEYTPETEKAMEEKSREAARAEGLIIQRTEAKRLMDDLPGLTAQEALNHQKVALLGVPWRGITIEGGNGQAIIFDGPLPNFGGGSGKGNKGEDKDDKPRKGGRK